MLKSDKWIIENATKGMITPFVTKQINKIDDNKKVISFGPSSFGYDIRLAEKIKTINFANNEIIDPKSFSINNLTELPIQENNSGRYFDLPPNSFSLGHTLERFTIPRNILVICLDKSTYARCGLSLTVTPLEPEWEGWITLEIVNNTTKYVRIYANEGIAQLLFFEGEECNISYKDRNGKYQNQKEDITMPKA